MDDIKEKLKKIPKWAWFAIAGGFVLLLFFRRSSGGVQSTGFASGGTDIGAGAGGASSDIGSAIAAISASVANQASTQNQVLQDMANAANANTQTTAAQIGSLNEQIGLLSEALFDTQNQLLDLSAAKSQVTPSMSIDQIISANNTLSKTFTSMSYVDSYEDTADLSTAIKNFTVGVGGANYNTATGATKQSLIQAEQLLKSGDMSALQAELFRTNSVISSGVAKDPKAAAAHKVRIETAIANIEQPKAQSSNANTKTVSNTATVATATTQINGASVKEKAQAALREAIAAGRI